MKPYNLLYPVHTLDGKGLLHAGSVVSEETMAELILTTQGDFRPLYPLMQHGSVKNDCRKFMGQPPYQTIFTDQKKSETVMDLMEEVHVHPAVLESLDYFKNNDFYTYRHSLMVSVLSSLLAQRLMSVSIDALRAIMTGPSHDMGKICVPIHNYRDCSISLEKRGVPPEDNRYGVFAPEDSS